MYTTKTKEARTRKKLTDEIPQAPTKHSKLVGTETQVKEIDEKNQPVELPPKSMTLAKKSKAQ